MCFHWQQWQNTYGYFPERTVRGHAHEFADGQVYQLRLAKVNKNDNVYVGCATDYDYTAWLMAGTGQQLQAYELLQVDLACALVWVPYTVVQVIPSGAVVAGYQGANPVYCTRKYHETVYDAVAFSSFTLGQPSNQFILYGAWDATTFDLLVMM